MLSVFFRQMEGKDTNAVRQRLNEAYWPTLTMNWKYAAFLLTFHMRVGELPLTTCVMTQSLECVSVLMLFEVPSQAVSSMCFASLVPVQLVNFAVTPPPLRLVVVNVVALCVKKFCHS